MRLSTAALLFSIRLAAAATTISTCNRDNCLRAVIASAFTTRHGSADCSSFFMKTVTPATVTVTSSAAVTTSTLTATALAKRDSPLEARQATNSPTSIPAYASPCSGTSAYSSACSCLGITQSTTTAPTPTTTTTISAISTITECASPFPTFALQLENSNIVLSGIPLDGTYANIDNGDGQIIGFNGQAESGAALFSLNAAGNIVMDTNGFIGYTDMGQTQELLHFLLPDQVVAQGGTAAVCSVAGGVLKCTSAPGVNVLQLCPGFAVTNDVWLEKGVHEGCVAPTFKVVPACTPSK